MLPGGSRINLNDLGRVSLVGSVLRGSCTTYDIITAGKDLDYLDLDLDRDLSDLSDLW